MRTLAIAAQKGGTGKTTIAAHLAVAASAKQRVVLVDTDKQGSLTAWQQDRASETPELVTVGAFELGRELQSVQGEDGLLVVDTPPQATDAIRAVIQVADLVLIPVKPSALDIRAVDTTRELAEKAGKPYLFVLSQALPRASMTAQAIDVLRTYGPVADAVLHSRVDYAASMADGRAASEIAPNGKAAGEIAVLWKQVNGMLAKQHDGKTSKKVRK